MSSRTIAWYEGERSKWPPSESTCSAISPKRIRNPFRAQRSPSAPPRKRPAKTSAFALAKRWFAAMSYSTRRSRYRAWSARLSRIGPSAVPVGRAPLQKPRGPVHDPLRERIRIPGVRGPGRIPFDPGERHTAKPFPARLGAGSGKVGEVVEMVDPETRHAGRRPVDGGAEVLLDGEEPHPGRGEPRGGARNPRHEGSSGRGASRLRAWARGHARLRDPIPHPRCDLSRLQVTDRPDNPADVAWTGHEPALSSPRRPPGRCAVTRVPGAKVPTPSRAS